MQEKDPFRTRDHVLEFDAIVAEMIARSAATRDSVEMVANIAYGGGEREALDLFFPPRPAVGMPVHIFIHGGYWRMFSKDDYSYVANTITASGALAVVVDYGLMPAITMETIVSQVQRMDAWVQQNIQRFGGDPRLVSVSGHSAGAQLATFLLAREAAPQRTIRSALLLGGIYDLQPLQASFLASQIEITDDDVARRSPMNLHFSRAAKVLVAVGEKETTPFHAQADGFARHLSGQGLRATRATLPNADHMTSVRDLGMMGTDACRLLIDMISGA